MQPLFEHYIPNLKLGFFMREYALAKREYADRLNSGEMTLHEIARRTVDSVENRFGEMNFDNMFWDRTLKTALQMTFRSVTWKLGNLRANVGAITGEAAEIKRAIQKRELPLLHANTAWLLGMMLWTGVMGSLIHRTFSGKWPESIKDVVYPLIGPIRVSLPTYFRDMVHAWHDPKGYVTSSMAGWIGNIIAVLRNKDFYSNEVWSPDDPLPQKTLDGLLKLFPLPFWASSATAAAAEGTTGWQTLTGNLGFPKAPKYIEQTPAEQLAYKYMEGERKQGARTTIEKQKSQLKSNIRRAFRAGTDASRLIEDGIKSGIVARRDIPTLRRQARESPLAAEMTGWSASKMLEVYDKANAEERDGLDLLIRRKLIRSLATPHEWTPRVRTLAKKYFDITPAEEPPPEQLEGPEPIS
jgi:hypothetical protein